jgi:hypothetical protein
MMATHSGEEPAELRLSFAIDGHARSTLEEQLIAKGDRVAARPVMRRQPRRSSPGIGLAKRSRVTSARYGFTVVSN